LVGIGWLILSQVNSLGIFYLSFIIICVGASGIGGVGLITLIARWFQKRLGLAMGLLFTGAAAGGLAVPGIVSLLNIVGFRYVFIIFSITAFILGCITAYFVRDRPEDIGSVPDGTPSRSGEYISEAVKIAIMEGASPHIDYSFKRAISKPAFWIISYVTIAALFSWVAVITHIMPYLESLGYSRYTASLVTTMLPMLSIVGRLFAGWISDRISFRILFILALLGQGIGMILCLYANLSFALILFAILNGITFGSFNVLRPIAMRRYYGTTNIGSILGLGGALGQIGSFTGPIFAGWLFDVRGSYDLAWIVAAILLLAGIPLLATLKQPEQTLR